MKGLWFSSISALHSGITEEDLQASGVTNPSHRRRILENLPKNWNWLEEVKGACGRNARRELEDAGEDWDVREGRSQSHIKGTDWIFSFARSMLKQQIICVDTTGKCFAAESALFIPPLWVWIKEGFQGEWKACGDWHLNTYWLNNHGLVGFVLKAFFSLNSGIQWRKALTIQHHPVRRVFSFTLLLSIQLLRL